MRRCRHAMAFLFIAAAFMCPASAPIEAQTPGPADPQLQAARQSFEQLNFEGARDVLTALIGRLTENTQETQRDLLASAYELRGRTLQNLRDLDGARSDFRAMLVLAPNYQFPLEAGARALALFEEVRAAIVGTVEIAIAPADADVRVDGRVVTDRPLRLALTAGVHALTAARRGHASISQQFDVRAGEAGMLTVTLERLLSSVTLQTIPANVTVLVDGASRGTTLPAPGASPGEAAADSPSQPFVIEEVPNGPHRIELRRDCYLTEQRQLDLAKPDGVNLSVIRLPPATGTITVRAEAAGATVFVDNKPHGEPTQVLNECQGAHVVEVRTRMGRDLRRFDLQPGQKEEFAAVVRPAFAIVTDSDLLKMDGAADGRLRAETLFRATKTVTLFAAPKTQGRENRDPASSLLWLAGGASSTSAGRTATSGTPTMQSESARLAADLESQGIAAVVPDPAGSRQSALLVLVAARSAKPDVLPWRIDDAASVREVIARLDALPVVTRPSLGLLAIDVLDVGGVVVGAVEPGAGAAGAGLTAGDIVTAAGGKPVTTAAMLLSAAAAIPEGQALTLDVRDRTGAMRKADVPVQRLPRLLDPLDDGLLANTLAVALTPRAVAPQPVVEAISTRLNLAVAWMRLDNWSAAIRELEAADTLVREATISAGVKDTIAGNTQYLLGVCAAQSGDATRAEQALTRAAQSPGRLLTESAEPLRELAERRLAELRTGR